MNLALVIISSYSSIYSQNTSMHPSLELNKMEQTSPNHKQTLDVLSRTRAVRYDDIYRMDEIKSLSFHIMFYRLFRGVAKYIVSGNTFSSFELLRSLHTAHHAA